jgi:ribosomal protein S18 acetylase RimI-like enzyme
VIYYRDSTAGLSSDQLAGFFDGWPNPPSHETHLEILKHSDHVIIAVEEQRVVGFVSAVTDGILSGYIPLLEVLPSHRGKGVGTELVRRMLEKLRHLYMIDLTCDPALQPFYERFGMKPFTGMIIRNLDRQSGGASNF